MVRVGMDRATGRVLAGWAHVVQSIGIILTTRVGSRVMRRAFGADVPKLQDANASRRIIMDLYVAVADALDKYEPGFRLRTIELVAGGRDGVFEFTLAGTYYPRGHLGDFSTTEQRTTALTAVANDAGYVVVSEAA